MMNKLTSEEFETLIAKGDQFRADKETLSALLKLLSKFSERENISPEIRLFCSFLMGKVDVLQNTLSNRNTLEQWKSWFE